MSHFSVLVVGDDADEQLAPYDEDRTTAPRREYRGLRGTLAELDARFETRREQRAFYAMKGRENSRGGTPIYEALAIRGRRVLNCGCTHTICG
jgi:hypothetical protein